MYQVMPVNKRPSIPGTAVLFGLLIWINVTAMCDMCVRGAIFCLYRHRMSYVEVGVLG